MTAEQRQIVEKRCRISGRALAGEPPSAARQGPQEGGAMPDMAAEPGWFLIGLDEAHGGLGMNR